MSSDSADSPRPSASPGLSADDAQALRRLQRLGRFMDSSIRLPGGYRIGWDGVIGLVPGIGDIVGLLVSSGILLGTARLGVPRAVLARMALNIGLETLVGSVPIVGDLFDMAFKANQRNLALATRAMDAPASTARRSGITLLLVGVALLLMVVVLGWAVVAIIGGLLSLLG